MARRYTILFVMLAGATALGEIISYEASSQLPEDDGWDRTTHCTPERTLQDNTLIQVVEPGQCANPPSGDRDSYTRSIEEFVGSQAFFIEWKVYANGDRSEFPWQAPAVVTAWSFGPSQYEFTMARDEVEFIQHSFVVVLNIAIAPDSPHRYRFEIFGDTEYRWYIDGELIYTGTPGGVYPAFSPFINWRANSAYLENELTWSYVRYGDIPKAGLGDIDGSGMVDGEDFYFFAECLNERGNGPGIETDPGCEWADMDADSDVDFADFREFQIAFTE